MMHPTAMQERLLNVIQEILFVAGWMGDVQHSRTRDMISSDLCITVENFDALTKDSGQQSI
jgi:hypothetical protein